MYRLVVLFFLFFTCCCSAQADKFSADFQGVDVREFINTVSKNLGKTIIVDQAVEGKVTVRSYEQLSPEEYYQFFLSVLDVYGYAVVNMPKNVLKVIPAKDGKRATLTPLDDKTVGDELVMKIVPLHHSAAKDMAPVIRQLNDSTGVGNVSHYENGNALLITGRADVVRKLSELTEKMDEDNAVGVLTIPLTYASAKDVTHIINELLHGEGRRRSTLSANGKIVSDERTNSVLISGDETTLDELQEIILSLDKEKTSHNSTKVIHLKYAKAQSLVDVLTGVSVSLQNEHQSESVAPVSIVKNVVIKADDHTNSLILSASADIMRDLEDVIAQLDVRRAQVLVEAIIVEMLDADGINFGIQWANKHAGGTQFSSAQSRISAGQDKGMGEVFKNANGLVAGFYSGNWAGLLTAISSRSQNNILATPSIVTLDNEDAEFSVGQDVPILTGSQTTNSDNVFNTVSRKTVGIKLKVKPQINKGQSVQLQIQQEVSSVADNNVGDSNNLGATFNVRTVNNSVLVDSGETVVVGGLLDKSQSKNKSGVPFLSDIPLLGHLFSSSGHKDNKRNLVLFIRPTIIRSADSYSLESYRKSQDFSDSLATKKKWNDALDEKMEGIRLSEQFVFLRAKKQIETFYGTAK